MKCPSCQYVNPDAARFCNNCGNRLASSEPGFPNTRYQAPASPLPVPGQAPVRALEGERKLVTVLFADVVGSTAMGENLDPEQVTDIMNGAFAFLNASVARYGGTVARLMGDAILAFFGAPVAHEDDPERAVRAGLAIQEAAQEYAQEVKENYGLDFDVRVGINTGLVVLDLVGDQIKTEYTAMGDTTNVAARMQSAAAPGTVLLSAETYRFVKDIFDFNPRGRIEVKGKSAPIETYEVVGRKATAGGYASGMTRGLEGLASPLIGRGSELELLRERLDGLQARLGGFVTIMGEAGLGKSRLVAEARKIADSYADAEITWLEGRAISYGQSTSYHPWRQIIRQTIGAQEGDSPESVRSKLKTVCTSNACNMPGGDVPFLEMLLAVESQESLQNLSGMSGDDLVNYITLAVEGHICCSVAEVTPTVLVLDDIHWADQASLDLLLNISGLIEKPGMLVICLLRPDKEAASWQFIEQVRRKLGDRYTEIVLEPLSNADSRELLGNLLHIEDLPDSVRMLILDKAEGNPFFVEEVIRSLIDSGHIVQEDGHWRATRDVANVVIPDTLAGVLGARIDRLPGDTKRVTQAAAVVGRTFTHKVLKTICEAAPPNERIEQLQPHLETLRYNELVRELSTSPELEYIFKHALTQEAAYNSLLVKRRKEYHRRTAAALVQLYPERLDELAPTLALHYWYGEDWPMTADYSMRAGDGAAKVYALRAAIEHYHRAMQALEKIPGANPEKLYDAILGWVQAAFRFMPYEDILAELARAVEIARSLGDKRRLAEALHWTGTVHIARGHGPRAIPPLAECLALAEELGDQQLALLPRVMVAFAHVDSDPRGAIARLEETVESARRQNNKGIEATALGIKAMAAARVGEFGASEHAINGAHHLIRDLDLPLAESDIDLFSAWSYLDMGEPGRGLRFAQMGVEKAISTDNVECICYGYACLGFNYMQLQQLPEAIKAFGESIKRSISSGAEQVESIGRTGLAMAEFFTGRSEAVQDMETTLERTRRLGDAYTSAFLSYALGEAYSKLGDYRRAEGFLQAALHYYRGNGMRPYLVRTLQSLASLYDKEGRSIDAARVHNEAEELAKELQLI